VTRTFRDGHAETWYAADATLGWWGPDGFTHLVVATADPGWWQAWSKVPHRPPSFTRIYDTHDVKWLKRERGAPEQPECDLSRIAVKLRRVHLFRARYFMGAWAGTDRG
jgi:hypothetical protein